MNATIKKLDKRTSVGKLIAKNLKTTEDMRHARNAEKEVMMMLGHCLPEGIDKFNEDIRDGRFTLQSYWNFSRPWWTVEKFRDHFFTINGIQ